MQKLKGSAGFARQFLILLVIGLGALLFTFHNEAFYQRPLAKVEQVHNEKAVKQTDEFKNVDWQTKQHLRIKMLNGKYRGHVLTVTNTYSYSGAMDQRYRAGNEIFLTRVHEKNGELHATIAGYKRDTVIVFLVWLVILMLLLMMRRQGSLALLSVIVNTILFMLAIELDLKMQAAHVLLIFGVLALIFTVISLVMILGFTRRMLATLGATVFGTIAAMLISLLVFNLTQERGIYYESMQYVTQVPRPLFLAETLLGSLGAVMDESSDIVATIFELKQLDPAATKRQLFLAGRSVGQSIMGPLVNVLFLIFMADTFTSSLLYLKNGNSWGYTFSMNMCLGTVQSLISGIGIVLVIPIASALAALLLGKKAKA